MTRSAGQRLRSAMDEALAHASKECGRALAWDEKEKAALEVAADAADRAAELRCRYRIELKGDAAARVLTQLSAEVPQLERLKLDALARVNVGLGPPKSVRHVRAARSRWDRGA